MAVIEERAKCSERSVESKRNPSKLVARIADDFGRGAQAARSQHEERPHVAVPQSYVAPGDVIIVFDVLPEIGAFGDGHAVRGRRTCFNAREQAEVLRIAESGALGEWWRIERDFDKDRKSTRLNSSHANISYAVFCLKKKKEHAGYAPLVLYAHDVA